jgi:hypothetical protein
MTADLTWLRGYEGRCPRCLLDESRQGHRSHIAGVPTGCDNSGPLGVILGRQLADVGMARTTAAHPDAVAVIDAAIMRRVRAGVEFSANSIRAELTSLTPDERPVIGARMNSLARSLCRKVRDEPSTDPGTHGKTVAVWKARVAA